LQDRKQTPKNRRKKKYQKQQSWGRRKGRRRPTRPVFESEEPIDLEILSDLPISYEVVLKQDLFDSQFSVILNAILMKYLSDFVFPAE
jgi:hypothetical protein